MPHTEFWPFQNTKQCKDGLRQPSCHLQKQLGDIEGEVKEIQMELASMRRHRIDSCPKKGDIDHLLEATADDEEVVKFCEDLQKMKSTSCLDEEVNNTNNTKPLFECKFKDMNVCHASCDPKDSRKVNQEEVCMLKTQARELRDEIEEMRITIDEKSEQLQEYRMKYLQAEQQVEELKRQIDVMDFDNKQASDQIQIELQKMKMQFQEKLLELAPLPDLLKGAQIQLQEALQLQKLAEDSAQQISNELQRVKEKLCCCVNSLNQEKLDKCKLIELNTAHMAELEHKNIEIEGLCKEVDDYKCCITRLEEKLCQLEKRYEEKCCEYAQLCQEYNEFKKESSRALCRLKERADSNRHCFQSQLCCLERQLVTCKAQCKTYQRERDEIRQRMQIQICNLKENFDMVECRLRGLQGQVTLLKHCYSVAHPDGGVCRQDECCGTSC